MIAIDTNVLVYAHRSDLPAHERAAVVVRDALSHSEPVALCWPVIHEFLAVVTNGRAFTVPSPADRAFEQVRDWLASPAARLIDESPVHLRTLESLVLVGGASGPILHDARIAAMCIDHEVRELWTADRDFARFPQLKVRNPLV